MSEQESPAEVEHRDFIRRRDESILLRAEDFIRRRDESILLRAEALRRNASDLRKVAKNLEREAQESENHAAMLLTWISQPTEGENKDAVN